MSREPIKPDTALITGASSGIGLRYAHALAARGCRLIVVSNDPKINEVATQLTAQYPIDVEAICMDLARAQAAAELYEACRGRQIDILINNAGIFFFRDICDTTPTAIETMIQLHVLTVTQLCRLFGADMQQRGTGWILNMSSIAASMRMPGIALYNSTKAFVRNFSQSLHHELKPYGVTVTVVQPGGVATDLYHLPARYQQLGIRLGVLMTPEQLVKKALRGMFSGRRRIRPGVLLNGLFTGLIMAIPPCMVRLIKRKIDGLLKK